MMLRPVWIVDTASVAVLIHGGGNIQAAARARRGSEAWYYGGGDITVYYDRAWPYLEVGRIENPDAVCHLVKIEMDYCTRTFGTTPCLATGTPCYNTWKTCKYIMGVLPGDEGLPVRLRRVPPGVAGCQALRRFRQVHAHRDQDEPDRQRSGVFTMVDEPDADVDTDTYWTQRSSHPGTYWKRWLARNVNYKGLIVRIYEGVYGRAESTFVQKWMGRLENIKVKGDRFTFEAVDLLKDLAKVDQV